MSVRLAAAQLGADIHMWVQISDTRRINVRAAGEPPPPDTRTCAHHIVTPHENGKIVTVGTAHADLMYRARIASLVSNTVRAQVAWSRRQPVLTCMTNAGLVEQELPRTQNNHTWFPTADGIRKASVSELRQIDPDVATGWFLPGGNPHMAGTLYIAPHSSTRALRGDAFVDVWELRKVGTAARVALWQWSDATTTYRHIAYMVDNNESHQVMAALEDNGALREALAADATLQDVRAMFAKKDTIRNNTIHTGLRQSITVDRDRFWVGAYDFTLQGNHQYKALPVAARIWISAAGNSRLSLRGNVNLSDHSNPAAVVLPLAKWVSAKKLGFVVVATYDRPHTGEHVTEHWIVKNVNTFEAAYTRMFGPSEPVLNLTFVTIVTETTPVNAQAT